MSRGRGLTRREAHGALAKCGVGVTVPAREGVDADAHRPPSSARGTAKDGGAVPRLTSLSEDSSASFAVPFPRRLSGSDHRGPSEVRVADGQGAILRRSVNQIRALKVYAFREHRVRFFVLNFKELSIGFSAAFGKGSSLTWRG